MYKLAAIIGGVLLMAGVAVAGTLTSLDKTNSPTIGSATLPAASTTVRQEDRAREQETRGRANEPGEDARGRANEAGEDLRGPCDEAEHANDARCTGGAAQQREDRGTEPGDDRGDSGPSSSSGRGSSSGHGSGSDDGGRDDDSGHDGGSDD